MNLSAHKKMLSTAAAASALLMTAACGSSEPEAAPAASTSTSAAADPTPTHEAGQGDERGEYNDGDYEATGQYVSPSGPSEVDVAINISEGVIADVVVTPKATHATSKQFQGLFASGIAAQVKGLSLDEAHVDAVAGSSLTGEGFNKAIDEIKALAKS
jgi:uncharacterized protein with FMN-binding domain